MDFLPQLTSLFSTLEKAVSTTTSLDMDVDCPLLRMKQLYNLVAGSLPNLQELTFTRTREPVDFCQSFGTLCPLLRKLHVSVEIVRSLSSCPLPLLGTSFPSLEHLILSVTDNQPDHDVSQMWEDMATGLSLMIGGDGRLRVLELSSAFRIIAESIPKLLDRLCLPESLVELRLRNLAITHTSGESAFWRRFQQVSVDAMFQEDLALTLEHLPNLNRLIVEHNLQDSQDGWRRVRISWDLDYPADKVNAYQHRLQDGFILSCPIVVLWGPGENVLKLVDWMAPLIATTSFQYTDFTKLPEELRQSVLESLVIPKLLPNLRDFTLITAFYEPSPGFSVEDVYIFSVTQASLNGATTYVVSLESKLNSEQDEWGSD